MTAMLSIWAGVSAVLAEFAGHSQAATASLAAAVWQGALLAVMVGLALRLLPKTPASVRFAIWFAVFAIVAGLPIIVAGLPMVAVRPHEAAAATGHAAWLTLDPRWSVRIAAVWLAASLWQMGKLTVAALRLRGLWKRATPLAVEDAGDLRPIDHDAALMARTHGSWLTARKRAEVCVSDEVDRPSVIGFLAPKILVPRWLLERLTPPELEQIVLHEAGHLGRADDWMNLLQKVALVIFPLNPALAWVERRLCLERELACDERVLQAVAGRPGAAKAYAAFLTTLAEHRLARRHGASLRLALGLFGRESELGLRVGRILRRGPGMRPAHARLVLGGAILGLLGGAVELARCPQLVGFSEGRTLVASADSHAQTAKPGSTMSGDTLPGHTIPGYPLQQVVFRNAARNAAVGLSAHRDKAALHGAHRAVAQRRPDTAWPMMRVVVFTGEDESRLILTTTPTPAAIGTDAGDSSLDNMPPDEIREMQAIYRIYRYAAVPTRDGWLVFKL